MLNQLIGNEIKQIDDVARYISCVWEQMFLRWTSRVFGAQTLIHVYKDVPITTEVIFKY